jgi:hypothetical protein
MVVMVTGQVGATWMRRRWRLRVLGGDGPFIPGVAARAILRDVGAIRPGARPALSELPLAQFVAAMEGLQAETQVDEAPVASLFADKVPGFATLPDAIRALHDIPGPRGWSGQASVSRGRGLLARIAAWAFRFPPQTDSTPVTVTMDRDGAGEVWVRHFGRHSFVSHLQPTAQGVTERFGPFTFLLRLAVQDGRLHYPVQRGWFLGLPLPRALLPVSDTVEQIADGRFTFDVRLSLPFGLGMVVHYRGWLVRGATA